MGTGGRADWDASACGIGGRRYVVLAGSLVSDGGVDGQAAGEKGEEEPEDEGGLRRASLLATRRPEEAGTSGGLTPGTVPVAAVDDGRDRGADRSVVCGVSATINAKKS